MKCLLIYNPVSGHSRQFIKKLSYVEKELKKKYEVVDIKPTEYSGHAIELAKESCGKYDVIIASGGDGTFSDVLKGLGENKHAPVLGYIPSGSCGDIAYNHNIPHSIKKAVKVILKGHKKEIDLCKINDTYFSYVAGLGTYTSGIYNTDQLLKKKLGKAAYYIEFVKETFNVTTNDMTITIGKKVYHEQDVILALVMNTKSIAGFPYFNYKAKMDDGKIDVVIIKKGSVNSPFNIWKLFLKGVEEFRDDHHVKVYTCSNVKIDVKNKINWNVDGDDSGYTDIDVKCLKKKITMFVGK